MFQAQGRLSQGVDLRERWQDMFDTNREGNRYPQTNGLVRASAKGPPQASEPVHHPTANISCKLDSDLAVLTRS